MSYNSKDKFEYDNSFHDKLVVAMLQDQDFLFKTISLDIGKYIESEPHSWYVNFIIQFFMNYKAVPSLDTIKLKLEQQTEPLLKQSLTTTFISMIDQFENNNIGFIKDTVINFCRFQELKLAITKSIDLLQIQGDYQKIYDLINETRYKGLDNDLGSEYVDSYLERHQRKTQNFISTPWPVLNNIMGGGLKQRKFGVVLAPPGVGKTWVLLNLAAQGMREGKNVVYYTLQMDEQEIGLRMDSLFLEQSQEFFYNPQNLKKGQQKIEKYRDFLKIKAYLPNKTRLIEIENHIKQLHLYQNFKVDMVIIDYADIVKKEGKTTSMYSEYGDVYTAIKTLSKELNIPVWSASQSNRSGIEAQVVLGDAAAHSLGKLQIADFVLSISRTQQDKVSDTARFAVIKNRGGRDGMVFNGVVNLDIGKIEMFDTFTQNSIQARKKMDDNSLIMKDRIRERLLNMRKEKNQEK